MAIIQSSETGFYKIELPFALNDSTHGTINHFQLNTMRIRDASGLEGVGYTYTIGHNGSAIAALLQHDIPDILAGQDVDFIEAIWRKLWWALHYGGRGGPSVLALSAVDMALWDLKCKHTGQPLHAALGGYDAKVPCYAGGVDLDYPIDRLLRQADDNIAKGFRALKMKVGRKNLSEDIERVKAMREHLGTDFPLMADANMKWSVDEAIRAARALQQFGLVWLEEPIVPDDVAGHRRVVAEGGVPIAAGENLRSLWEFKQLISSGGVTYPEPDVTNVGGITAFMKVAHLAEAYNLPCTSHGAHDVTVHLLASIPNRSYLEVHGFGLDRYIAEPLHIEDGFAIASQRPGHGIAFDWKSLDRCRV